MTIWKFPLETTDYQTVQIPQGGEILCAQMQAETLCLWALVDPKVPLKNRHIRIFGTGHPVTGEHLDYIGTYQINGGSLVFHVFEECLK